MGNQEHPQEGSSKTKLPVSDERWTLNRNV